MQGRERVKSWRCAAILALWAGVTPRTASAAPASATAEVEQVLAELKQHHAAKEWPRAEKAGLRCVTLAEQKLGRDHTLTGSCLNNLAAVYFAEKKFDDALAAADKASAIVERTDGPEHARFGLALGNKAELMLAMGRAREAVAPATRAAQIVEAALGPEHPLLSTMLEVQSRALRDNGKLVEALAPLERAAEIRDKSIGPDSLELAEVLDRLGRLTQELGDHSRAARAFERGLGIVRTASGAEHLYTAFAEGNLGNVLLSTGDYRRALPLLEHSASVLEKQLTAESNDLANARINVAMVRHYLGQYELADTLLKGLLSEQENVAKAKPGSNVEMLALMLSNLGQNHLAWGNYDLATTVLERALTLRREHVSPDDPKIGYSLLSVAAALSYKGERQRADALLDEAIALWTKSLGGKHRLIAIALNNRARLNDELGRFDESQRLYDGALAILDELELGDTPDAASTLENRSMLLGRRGHTAAALTDLSRANDVRRQVVDSLIGLGTEAQKSALVSAHAVRSDYALALHLDLAPDDANAAAFALTTVLERKGLVLDAVSDSLSAVRRRLEPADEKLLDELFEVRSRLSSALFGNIGLSSDQKATLQKRASEIEEVLSAKSEPFRAARVRASVAAVQSRLPDGAALVELVRYPHFDAKKTPMPWGEPHYAAYVLTRRGAPRWVQLGPARWIDKRVEELRKALADPFSTNFGQLAQALDERLWRPLEPLFNGVRRVLLSPEGPLNLLPFEALIDRDGRYRIEGRSISYLTSGRDLLRTEVRPESRSAATIVADPDFDHTTSDTDASAAPKRSSDSERIRLKFKPLPATREEAKSVHQAVPGAVVLTRERADKEALRRLHGPAILHLATHGFFLDDGGAPASSGTRGLDLTDGARPRLVHVDNPLLRSGLAFSGANQRSVGNPGVLSALEASGLDLQGTRLVVLSACETGVGEVRQSEGVYGLRRAFVMAGAETLVMSLWNVDDAATRTLMVRYYAELMGGAGRGDALRHAQLTLLKDAKTAHPHYWAGFISSGAWSPLQSASEEKGGESPATVAPSARGCACNTAPRSRAEGWLSFLVLAGTCGLQRQRRRPARRPYLRYTGRSVAPP